MPIITISRGTFSGGTELASCLARELGLPCVSREVVVEAAQQYGVAAATLQEALSHAPTLLERVTRDRDKYLALIRAAVFRHARAGDFIYHGHAGHHLLAGVRHLVRVRVVANLAYRISAAMTELSMTSRQAEAHIRRVDDERRKWTRFLYGVAWEDPGNYDVVLNLEYMGVQGACEAVVRLSQLEQFQPTPDSRRAFDNLALQSFVHAALACDERTSGTDFRVRANDGVVTLEGVVKSREAAEAARDVASRVEGVRSVVSQVGALSLPV